MTNVMKAAVVHSFGQPLTIEEVPVPTPGPGQVLVRVKASGVCHTDVHAAHGDWPVKPTLPFIPGHEGAGYVAAIGSGVTSLHEGDRVGVPWLHSACGTCDYCLTGWETLCPNQQNTGYSVNGSYAEYVLAPAAYVGHLPKESGFAEIAPILCAGVTTYKGLKQTEVRPGEWVVISGVGGLGHVAVQYAKAMGMHVAAVDVADDKLALARSLGAEVTANAATEDPVEKIQREINGAHGVLITAVSPAAFNQGLGMLRRGGTCALVGLPPGNFPAPIFDIVLKGLTVRGSIVGTRKDLQEALEFAAEGKVKATIELQPMEAINTVFSRMLAGQVQGRVVMQID
jgi:propanol-preferring alcohol dehydrogenase